MKREEVKHWLGNSYEDWIEDLMFRLLNNKVSVEEIKKEEDNIFIPLISKSTNF